MSMLDLIIKNGKVVDGTGNPWFYGDVGVANGVIAAVGRLDVEAHRIIDAQKRVISPGFIDGHCHSDLMILDYPHSEIKLRQGVTTEVIGNCGLAPAPFVPSRAELLQTYVQPVLGSTSWKWPWETVGEYMAHLAGSRPSEHVATYVAHGALRIAAMGFENRPATSAELEHMKQLLEEGLKAGAIGFSIGLLYAPGSYTSKEELVELCRVLPKYNGLFSTHIRGEGNNLLPSVKEVIWIAEASGVSLHISHLKAAGKRNWGKALEALELIEDARARGLDVTCDVYPYSAGSTMLTTVLPPWTLEGGIGSTLERFRDPALRQRVKKELGEEQTEWDNLVCSTGWEAVIVSSVRHPENAALEGKSIAEISEVRGQHPADCVMDLLLEEDGQVSIVYFHMADNDVEQVVGWEKSLIASDSLHCETGKPHPRLYGSFPRLFSRYVREKKTLSLEQAVRKVTSFPVQRFKLGKRGLLVPGYAADLAVFDPATIHDRATFQDPRQYPEGISHVIVNGSVTLDDGEHTKAREGTLIRAQHCCGIGHHDH
ncbi:N-acyl-D-amino-acid deacylase family protein [Paenibacillus radicis (ex Xue et al. 2023)]|uniref:D-aminoacylase n=1 Tax=Paenibacillus radicis (ex Xue et al. 2023) TaxID=2972489 RepID=A0ABT1YMF6_9BACL|nr:D-aminoacylase [Paenibacillus radicis (ex Xue et al. 2023)]MCR8634356.1 D-aminoacylase [Paenibacillus radicis (ex Xue et al. 2023)]